MKKLLFILFMIVGVNATYGQYIYKIKADSVLITNDSCTAELNLENSTKNVKGFLYNKGNGRTEFRKAVVLNDSSFILGSDTLVIRGASNSWRLTGNAGTSAAANFLGTVDSQALVFRTKNIERMRITPRGFVGINTNNPTSWLHIMDTTGSVNPQMAITANGNGFTRYDFINTSAGGGAGAGAAYWNNANELMQLYMGSTNNGFTPSMALLRCTGANGMKISADHGPLTFQIGTVIPARLADSGNIKMSIDSFGVRLKQADLVTFDTASYQAVVIHKTTGRLYKTNNIVANAGSGSGWQLTGNAGTSPATNFIGTTDAQDIAIRTNNAERVRVANTGKVGINVTNPLYKLDVRGSSDSSYTMIHLSRDTTDNGGYIGISQHPVMLLSADATANSYNGNWVAKGTAAAMMSIAAGNSLQPNFAFFLNTGLTPGQTFSPWNLMQINGGDAYGSMRGIGIGDPISWHRLHVSSADSNVLGLRNAGALSATSGAMLRMYNSGTPSAADQRLGALAWGTGSSISAMRNAARIQCFSEAAWTDNASQPSYLTIETTPAGSNTPVERMRFTSAGNVGIGTSTPTQKLHVAGQGLFADTLTAAKTVSVAGNINVTQGVINMTTTGISPHININANQDGWPRIVITNVANTASAGAGALFVNNAGNILQEYIGSSSNAFVPSGAEIRCTGTGGLAIVADSGVIAFGKDAHMGTSEFARFLTNGNLGIGTQTPAYKLDVNGKLAVRTMDSTATPANILYQDAATGEIKKAAAVEPYKKYVALVTQSGTGDPTVTVLENTLGAISWTRSTNGYYTGTLSGAFTQNKTWLRSEASDIGGNITVARLIWSNSNAVTFNTKDASMSNVDGYTNLSIEIRVYP